MFQQNDDRKRGERFAEGAFWTYIRLSAIWTLGGSLVLAVVFYYAFGRVFDELLRSLGLSP